MFNTLTEKLNSAFHVLKGHGKITEINVAETLKEVRRALLDADVSFKIAKEFTQRVKEKSIGKNVLTDLRPGQLMVKIVKDELTQLMGGEHEGINLSDNPSIILLSLSFLTEMISLTNFTVKLTASAVLSNFSIAEDLMPTKVNSDLIFFEFLSSIAFLKLSFISLVSKLFKLSLSPLEKDVIIVS